jgi:pyruvate dehydrogenase complex dehydrogenase (E1) component
VRLLSKLLRDPEVGKLIVPIIPDEARTFGMEALFRQIGIYSSAGQLYERRARPMPTMASTPSPSLFITRCLDSSALGT